MRESKLGLGEKREMIHRGMGVGHDWWVWEGKSLRSLYVFFVSYFQCGLSVEKSNIINVGNLIHPYPIAVIN